jgi:hypothetical protein
MDIQKKSVYASYTFMDPVMPAGDAGRAHFALDERSAALSRWPMPGQKHR